MGFLKASTTAVLTMLTVVLFASPSRSTVIWDESINGNLSNNQAAPTPLTLSAGINSIVGTVTGTTKPQDWVALTVPVGFELNSIVLAVYQSTDMQGFTGSQRDASFVGNPFTAPPYVGYAHFGTGATNGSLPATNLVGTDLLPLMANPMLAAGAQGFTPPLGSGTYTFLIQKLGAVTNFQFDYGVVAVPEPSTGLLLVVIAALCSAQLLKRRQTERSSSGLRASVPVGRLVPEVRQEGESVVWPRGIPLTSNSTRLVIISATVVAGMLLSGVASADTLAATATISSAPNSDGVDFDYTIKLTDTGTTDIGTFWFAWTPPPTLYDLLPSSPTSTSQPVGWTGLVVHTFPGSSIEYYNVSGSAISAGQTGTFDFTSSDEPAQLQGLVLGTLPVTESFIYSGAPLVGTPAQVNPVLVPEPSSPVLFALGLIGMTAWDRRRKR